jgi:hypothetical protein
MAGQKSSRDHWPREEEQPRRHTRKTNGGPHGFQLQATRHGVAKLSLMRLCPILLDIYRASHDHVRGFLHDTHPERRHVHSKFIFSMPACYKMLPQSISGYLGELQSTCSEAGAN